jgi:hypothetical protein
VRILKESRKRRRRSRRKEGMEVERDKRKELKNI